jgi:DsbC/DsbD-like thiol-disulfide interchange protein
MAVVQRKIAPVRKPMRTEIDPAEYRRERRPRRAGGAATAWKAACALLLGCCFLAPPPAGAAASPWTSNPQSAVRLVSAYRVAPRHGQLRLGIQFRLAPRWHIYWKNSGDAGYAPVVAFARQPGLSYPELLWPAPHRFELAGGLEAFGYAGEVVYPVRARLDTAADLVHLTADVDYLTCEVDCVPHRYTLKLDQRLADRAEPDPEAAALLDRFWNELPATTAERPGVGVSIAITATTAITTITAPGGGEAPARTGEDPLASAGKAERILSLRLQGVTAGPGGADLFFEVHPALELGRPRLRPEAGGLVFAVPVSRKDSSAPFPAATVLAWTATGLRQGGAPFALTGRSDVRIAASSAAPPAGRAPTAPAGLAPTAASADPRWSYPRQLLADGDPRLFAVLAAAAAYLALELWGLLRQGARRDTPNPGALGAAPTVTTDGRQPARREALGFLALLATLGLLYALSREITPEGLSGVELALLGMGLLAWLRRTRRAPAARMLLALGLAACAVAPLWLAQRSRLLYAPSSIAPHRAPGPQAAPGRPPS